MTRRHLGGEAFPDRFPSITKTTHGAGKRRPRSSWAQFWVAANAWKSLTLCRGKRSAALRGAKRGGFGGPSCPTRDLKWKDVKGRPRWASDSFGSGSSGFRCPNTTTQPAELGCSWLRIHGVQHPWQIHECNITQTHSTKHTLLDPWILGRCDNPRRYAFDPNCPNDTKPRIDFPANYGSFLRADGRQSGEKDVCG